MYMFCPYCGAKLHNSMNFCYSCGKKVKIAAEEPQKSGEPFQRTHRDSIRSRYASTPAGAAMMESADYDRDALKTYLCNLQSMEGAMYKLRHEIYHIDDKIASLGTPNTYVYDEMQIYGTDENGELIRNVDTAKVFRTRLGTSVWIGLACVVLMMGASLFYAMHLSENQTASMAITIVASVIFLTYLVEMTVRYRKIRKSMQSEREKFRNFRKDEKARIEAEQDEKEELIKRRAALQQEYSAAESLLKKMYGINILPYRFRNGAAVIYLYNKLMSTTDSFGDILLHCEVESQTWNGKKILKHNSDAIVRNTMLLSQNPDWQQIQDVHLRQLASEEEDEQLSSIYTRISETGYSLGQWVKLSAFLNKVIFE